MTAAEVIVCRGPKMTEAARWDEGVRWCFVCRERVQFWQIVRKASDEDIMATYGFYTHSRSIECERGHWNGDLFPGRSREWDDE